MFSDAETRNQFFQSDHAPSGYASKPEPSDLDQLSKIIAMSREVAAMEESAAKGTRAKGLADRASTVLLRQLEGMVPAATGRVRPAVKPKVEAERADGSPDGLE